MLVLFLPIPQYPQLHAPQDREPHLALDGLDMSLSSLRLLFHPHRLALDAHDPHATHEEALVHPRASAIGVVARSEGRGPVEPQNGANGRVGEVEREPEFVAGGEQVGSRMQVCDDIVWGLSGEGGK